MAIGDIIQWLAKNQKEVALKPPKTFWKPKEEQSLIKAWIEWKETKPYITELDFAKEWGVENERSVNAVRGHLAWLRADNKLPSPVVKPSPYPVYDEPLEMDGDTLILPDIEFPFHHAEFVSACLELARKWDIR